MITIVTSTRENEEQKQQQHQQTQQPEQQQENYCKMQEPWKWVKKKKHRPKSGQR